MFKQLHRFRWFIGAGIAYLMGFPMATKAVAADAGDIVGASLSLAAAIIGVAGDS